MAVYVKIVKQQPPRDQIKIKIWKIPARAFVMVASPEKNVHLTETKMMVIGYWASDIPWWLHNK